MNNRHTRIVDYLGDVLSVDHQRKLGDCGLTVRASVLLIFYGVFCHWWRRSNGKYTNAFKKNVREIRLLMAWRD